MDNELSWGDSVSLGIATLASPTDQPAKRAFIESLRDTHKSIESFNRACGTEHASWEALAQSTTPPDPKIARLNLEPAVVLIAEQYFRVIKEEINAVAPDLLYLGCRFSNHNDAAVQVAARHCDVVSFNCYRPTVNLKFPNGYDLPTVIGEFHFGALDRGMFHTGLRPTENQAARAAAYTHYIDSALARPEIVGAHWFTFGSQATTGRGDGENYQIGLLDLCDTPYWETIEAIREVGARLYTTRARAQTTQ